VAWDDAPKDYSDLPAPIAAAAAAEAAREDEDKQQQEERREARRKMQVREEAFQRTSLGLKLY
jgi:ribosomal protein L12E/L44/L45/RPP1/RPP2